MLYVTISYGVNKIGVNKIGVNKIGVNKIGVNKIEVNILCNYTVTINYVGLYKTKLA